MNLQFPSEPSVELNSFPLEINQIIDVIDDLAEGIYGIDLNGKCNFCNARTLEILRYKSVNQLLGQNMHQLIHHSYQDGRVRNIEEFELNKSLLQSEIVHSPLEWLWRQDGTCVAVEIWSYPYYKNGIISGAIVAFIDISERVRLQHKMENSLERYRLLIESTQVVPWEYDLNSQHFTFISPQAEDMFGYPLTDWYKEGFWERIIHPEDIKYANDECNKALKISAAYELEYRIIKADKAILHVKDFVNVIYKDTSPVGLRGVFTDISTSKVQEEELRLAAVTFDTASGIFITDKNGIIIKTNSAFTEITGYQAHEVLGKTPQLFRSERHNEKFYKKMWSDLKKHGRWQGEIWNTKRSGELLPEWLTISAVKNTLNEISHYVAIFIDISKVKMAEEKIKYQAHYDDLTGLPNRTLLSHHLKQAITQARKFSHHGALLLLDLDEFKIINDSLGHKFGDKLLKKIAKRLSKLISNGDVLARLGGDEFAILLPDLGGDQHASLLVTENLARTICQTLLREHTIDGENIHISACIGISIFSKRKATASDVLKQADTAMYKAKASGKNCHCCFTDDMQQDVDKKLSIQRELKFAIANDQLELYFQPQFDNQKNLSGMEALVRWNHPIKGMIMPNNFIPEAEKSGLIMPLGRWVLQSACETYADWLRRCNFSLPRLSVNVSSQQFKQESFAEMVLDCLQTSKLTANILELEITEEMMIDDIDKTITVIEYLKDKGINFSVDDFGTGYSSLSYLKKLPIDLLKIDRSFIMNIPEDKDDIAITKTILSIAKHLNLKVIAEGVEDEFQYQFLQEHGCNFYQGYYFSRPLSKQVFERDILKISA